MGVFEVQHKTFFRGTIWQLPETPYAHYYLLMAGRGQGIIEADEISLKERFFRFFQHEITGI
jgi:hypothetical protein